MQQERCKTGLLEVFVRRQSAVDFSVLHDDERNAIGQTPLLVHPIPIQFPASIPQISRSRHHFDIISPLKMVNELHRVMPPRAAREYVRRFEEDRRRGYDLAADLERPATCSRA